MIQSPKELMMAQTLRKTPIFAKLPQHKLEKLMAGCSLQQVPKGNYLFHEGEISKGFYVIHTGAVNIHRVTEDGREQVIRVFYPAESFGEAVLVGNEAYPASAKTTENSQVILIPAVFFRQQIEGDPDLALNILASMSLHLRFLVETVEDLKLKQAESRVGQWLLRQLEERGMTDGKPVFTLPLPKHLLASQLGITSETLSRVFAKMREASIISIEGKDITFLSLNALKDFIILQPA